MLSICQPRSKWDISMRIQKNDLFRKTYRMAFIQRITSIISKLAQQSHVLQQFLLSIVTHTKTLEDILVDFMGKFNIVGSFASSRILFREFLQNLGQGVVLGGTVNTLSENLLSVEKDTFDEFTSVLSCNILVSNAYKVG